MARHTGLFVSLGLLLATTPAALAGGDLTLTKSDGSTVHIICNPMGCVAMLFDKKGNRVGTENSEGGNVGYAETLKKFQDRGYK